MSRRPGDRTDMRLTLIAVVLCACVWLSAADVAHLKSAKAKLFGRLTRVKHHKRGVLSSIPPFKLGYDIPVVTHSVVKPLVVSYPPAAAVTAVKVPLSHPLTARFPVPGHKIPVSHLHYGPKFPHNTKTVLLPKPDHHFHHHHHHVEPKPIIPIVPAPVPVPATPVVPVGAPTAHVAHPVPAPSPPVVIQPAPLPAPAPVFPSAAAVPHTHLLTPEHVHLRPVVQATAPVPLPPTPVAPITPLLPYAQQFPYVIRPGNAVQTSFFATYPRFPPLFHYQSPIIPLTPTAGQVLFGRPQAPHIHLVPQAGQEGVVIEQPGDHVEPALVHAHDEVPHPTVHLQPTHPTLHIQPTQPGIHLQPDVHLHHDGHVHPDQPEIHLHNAQPGILQGGQPGVFQSVQTGSLPTQPTVHFQPTQPLDQDGWHPVQTQTQDIGSSTPGGHFGQEANLGVHFGNGVHFGQENNFVQDGHHQYSTPEQGTQAFGHNSGDQQYHDIQNQLQHHIQQQLEQAQYEQHLHNQQHQLDQEYGTPQSDQGFNHNAQDFSQQNFAQHGQDFNQQGQHFGQDFNHNGQNFGQDFNQHGQNIGQDFNQQGQNFGQDFNQHGQNFGQDFGQGQPAAEYGVPQSAEGRSSAEGEEEYHNHIPLKLQPPIDRPLEQFRSTAA